MRCKYYNGNAICLAFDKIPLDIFYERISHDKIIEDQKGDYVFTPKETDSEDFNSIDKGTLDKENNI